MNDLEVDRIMIKILTNLDLKKSSVVANSTMNRQRACVGSNSYTKELLFNPIEFLQSGLESQHH
jgi:hypothetical protein